MNREIKPSTLVLPHCLEMAFSISENWFVKLSSVGLIDLIQSHFCVLQLAHPVLESLKNQEESWLVDLLFIMNAGDIAGFHKLKPKWSTQTDLLANERTVLQKITLLALMEVDHKQFRSISIDIFLDESTFCSTY